MKTKHSLACFFIIAFSYIFSHGHPISLMERIDNIHQRVLNLAEEPSLESSIQQLQEDINTLFGEIDNNRNKALPEALTQEKHISYQVKLLKLMAILEIIDANLKNSDNCDLDYLQNLAQLNPDFAPTIDAFIKWIRSKS